MLEITIGVSIVGFLVGLLAYKRALIIWPVLLIIANAGYFLAYRNSDALWIIGQLVVAGLSVLTIPIMVVGVVIRSQYIKPDDHERV